MLPAPAALLASLALASVTRYTASVSAVGRYYTDLEVLEPLATTSLEVEPRLGLEHEARASLFRIAYYPRLVMIVDSPPPQFFNQASLSLDLRPEPILTLTASASGCYGTNDFRVQYALACGAAAFGTLPGAAPPPVPRESTVKYMSAYGALGVRWQPSPRTTVAGTVSYLAQGGADAPTREVLPLQRGPSFLASLEWAAGRDDTLATSLSGSYYGFLREAPELGSDQLVSNAWISQLLETWQHRFGRSSALRIGLGVGATGNAIDLLHLVLRRTSVVGETSYRQFLGPEPEAGTPVLSLGVRAAPFVDFTTGLAYERAEAFAGLAWPLGGDWRLEASGSAAEPLDGVQRGQTTGAAQLGVTWVAERWLRFSAGVNGLWQEAGPDFPANSFRQAGVFLGATLSHRDSL